MLQMEHFIFFVQSEQFEIEIVFLDFSTTIGVTLLTLRSLFVGNEQ